MIMLSETVILALFLLDIVCGNVVLQDFFQSGNELYCDDEDHEHNYLNLALEPKWKPNHEVDWAVLCYGATGRDDKLPLEVLKSIYDKSAKNLRAAAPRLVEIEFWHSQTFDGTNSTEEEILHHFQAQFIRSLAEAQLVANSASNHGFLVTKIISQYLIQVRDCEPDDITSRCTDPMDVLRRSYQKWNPKITHFEAFLQRKLNGGVEFDFFATYLVTVRNQRVFSGFMGSSVTQGEDEFRHFELFKKDFF